jgi:lysophospholipase L1-like esterase
VGEWEGLDVPHIREVRIGRASTPGPAYLPVESFGKIYLQADNWHTDATGYDLIAKEVAKAFGDLR